MKWGFKHNTGYFGSGGEVYCASLFQMARIDNGHTRPDLISVDKKLGSHLAIEVKSGKDKSKKDMSIGSLLYSVLPLKSNGDTVELNFEEVKELIYSYGSKNYVERENSVAVYFDSLQREDALASEDISNPYSSISFKWGDQLLVPGKYAFFAFAVADYQRREQNFTLESIVENLKTRLFKLPTEGHNRMKGDWQNLFALDIKYFLTKDPYYLERGDTRKRVDDLRKIYPEVDDLKVLSITGPNNTTIGILAEPNEAHLFEKLGEIIYNRNPIIEKLTNQRKSAEKLLSKLKIRWQPCFQSFIDSQISAESQYDLVGSYTPAEIKKLERLKHWLAPGEQILKLQCYKALTLINEENIERENLFFPDGDAKEPTTEELQVAPVSSNDLPF